MTSQEKLTKQACGFMNLPKEVKDALKITESKGKIVFIEENSKVYVEKA